jgi:hypothetical protein
MADARDGRTNADAPEYIDRPPDVMSIAAEAIARPWDAEMGMHRGAVAGRDQGRPGRAGILLRNTSRCVASPWRHRWVSPVEKGL